MYDILKIVPLLLVATLNMIMGLLVIVRDPKKKINIWFSVLAISCAAWVGGIAGFYIAQSAAAEIAWAKFYYFAPLLLVATAVVVSDLFPNGTRISPTKFWVMLTGFLALTSTLIFSPNFLIQGAVHHTWGAEIILNKPAYLIYSAYIVLGFYWMLTSIHQKRKTERGISKTQADIFFYGTLASASLGTLFNLFLPWFGNYRLIWVGPLATSIYISTTLYSIVKHKLFDIRLVIARSLGYVLALTALGAIYGIFTFGIVANLLPDNIGTTQEQAIFTLLVVATAIAFPATKRFFDRVTNQFFYRDAYDPQLLIDHLNLALVMNTELEKMLGEASGIIAENIKSQYCLFGIKETDFQKQRAMGTIRKTFPAHDVKAIRSATPQFTENVIVTDYLEQSQHAPLRRILDRNDIAVLVRLPIAGDGEGVGYIVLGPKKSGNPYNAQDIRILDIISKELSIAIQNALHYEEIENFNITLHREIEDATRKLRRTNEKLKRLDEIKDDFISMASHQLRTPLTSVKGYVSMVLEGDAGGLTPMQRKLLNQSFISSQRMAYLISDLLNVSRLRTGKFIIDPVPSNLANVVQDEVAQLQETVKGRNLTLEYHKPKSFPTVMIDETKIRQVIMNFIDNAIYYTPSGGRIVVKLAEMPKSIELTVTDNGIGVPKYERHRLFTKFFRAHNAQKARPDGTGLGLFMAKKVIIAQGGAVIFKSQEGKGSTFGFTFPKTALVAPPKPEVMQPRLAPTTPPAPQTEPAGPAAQSAPKKD